MLCSDVTDHLQGVVRQKGGLGSQSYDEKQEDIRKFFGGGGGNEGKFGQYTRKALYYALNGGYMQN